MRVHNWMVGAQRVEVHRTQRSKLASRLLWFGAVCAIAGTAATLTADIIAVRAIDEARKACKGSFILRDGEYQCLNNAPSSNLQWHSV